MWWDGGGGRGVVCVWGCVGCGGGAGGVGVGVGWGVGVGVGVEVEWGIWVKPVKADYTAKTDH